MQMTKNILLSLSENELLNRAAKKWGYKLGANQFIAGTDIQSTIKTVKSLNDMGMSCTVDHLGEFVTEREDSLQAKENILTFIECIQKEALDCHISVKLTQLGLDIDDTFCLQNMIDIVSLASKYNIFINIDTEDYAHYAATFAILDKLREKYTNVGTVIQAYYHHAQRDLETYQDMRLRIVKGAYKESDTIAYQSREEIDAQFIRLAKQRLMGNAFTSIATHDHHIIQTLITFIQTHDIPHDRFEFQMLYGFRHDLQKKLVESGYHFCTYVPFGIDWYGYFMRRLAERPQNIELIIKDKLYTERGTIKKGPLILGASSLIAIAYCLQRRKK